MDKLTLSATEAAQVLGVSRTKVYELLRREDFPTIMLGGRRLINAARLQEWLDKQTRGHCDAEKPGGYK